MNNLALSDYVNLDDKHDKYRSILMMIAAFIVLMFAYQNLEPWLIEKFSMGPALALVLVMTVVVVGIAYYFSRTFRIVNNHIKFGKITLILFILYVLIMVMVALPEKERVFKSSETAFWTVMVYAITGGVIEEALFRGLLLNAFIQLFSKTKYVFIWASLCEGLCFSLSHFINLGHQSFATTLGQVIDVFGLGLLFTYMRFASNGIILGMLWHVYHDITPQLDTPNFGIPISYIKIVIIYTAVLSIFALICIYSYNRRYNKGMVKIKH